MRVCTYARLLFVCVSLCFAMVVCFSFTCFRCFVLGFRCCVVFFGWVWGFCFCLDVFFLFGLQLWLAFVYVIVS